MRNRFFKEKILGHKDIDYDVRDYEMVSEDDRGVNPYPFLDRYAILQNIETHEYYESFLVRRKSDKLPCIAKIYDPEADISLEYVDKLLSRAKHPWLQEYVESFPMGTASCVVRKYVTGDSITYITRKKRFSTDQIYLFALQICEVLVALHNMDPPVYHGAINDRNVIIDDENVTIIDIDCIHEDNKPEYDIEDFGMLLRFMISGKREKLRNAVEGTLNYIVENCVARNYETMDEVMSALEEIRPNIKGRRKLRYILLGGIFLVSIAVVAIMLHNVIPGLL